MHICIKRYICMCVNILKSCLCECKSNTCCLTIAVAMQHDTLGSHNHVNWLAPSVYIFIYILLATYLDFWLLLSFWATRFIECVNIFKSCLCECKSNTCCLKIAVAMQHETLGSHNHVRWLAPSVYIFIYILLATYLDFWLLLSFWATRFIEQMLRLIHVNRAVKRHLLSTI